MIPQIKPFIQPMDIEATVEYLKSDGWLTEHKVTEQFEREIADFIGSKYCSVVTSGTAGLVLALMAAGIGKGKKVAVPVLTMIATANAVLAVGAEPIFMDLDYKIPENVNAVIHVSLNGRAFDIERISAECRQKGILLIEDACQSFGSSVRGRKLGTFGDIGVYSFSPHKIITTGQGGAVVTDDKVINRNIELLKDFGRTEGGVDFHPYYGLNYKFTDLQASIGLSQLKGIENRIRSKREIYDTYYNNLSEFMYRMDNGETPWFVQINVESRDELAEYLCTEGIGTRPMYPLITEQPIYKSYNNFPIAKKSSKEILWLPSWINLDNIEIEEISLKILNWLKER